MHVLMQLLLTAQKLFLVKPIYIMHPMLPAALMLCLKFQTNSRINEHLNFFSLFNITQGKFFLKIKILLIYYDPVAY